MIYALLTFIALQFTAILLLWRALAVCRKNRDEWREAAYKGANAVSCGMVKLRRAEAIIQSTMPRLPVKRT